MNQEKAKKNMIETEKKIEDERKTVIGKRQAIDQESRMAQERIATMAREPHTENHPSNRNKVSQGGRTHN